MSWGQLSLAQQETIKPFIKNKIVHDVGAGDLALSRQLLTLGAHKVVAIDKEDMPGEYKGIEKLQMQFRDWDLSEHVGIAFISYPSNHNVYEIEKFLYNSDVVIYLGNNFDGTSCANQNFFKHLLYREVFAYVPHPKNTLIIYGGSIKTPRTPLPEEDAGIDLSRVKSFQEAHGFGWAEVPEEKDVRIRVEIDVEKVHLVRNQHTMNNLVIRTADGFEFLLIAGDDEIKRFMEDYGINAYDEIER